MEINLTSSTWCPPDRYVTPGECATAGHVFVWSQDKQLWRCAGCTATAMSRPAAPVDGGMYPMPQPIRLRPQPLPPVHPGFTPQPVVPMMPMPQPPTLPWTVREEFGPVRPSSPCAFDNLPPDMQGKPIMLACHCPRCSPQC